MTAGEIARLVNLEMGIGCDLEVIPCDGWRREMWYDETGLRTFSRARIYRPSQAVSSFRGW